MSLESNIEQLSKELETGEGNGEKAYQFNYLTMEIVEDVVELLPKEEYVKKEIIPLFEKALEIIKTSSPNRRYAKYMEDFANCINERIAYLKNYHAILEYIFCQ